MPWPLPAVMKTTWSHFTNSWWAHIDGLMQGRNSSALTHRYWNFINILSIFKCLRYQAIKCVFALSVSPLMRIRTGVPPEGLPQGFNERKLQINHHVQDGLRVLLVECLKHDDVVHGDALWQWSTRRDLDAAKVGDGTGGIPQELLVLLLLTRRFLGHTVVRVVAPISSAHTGAEPADGKQHKSLLKLPRNMSKSNKH